MSSFEFKGIQETFENGSISCPNFFLEPGECMWMVDDGLSCAAELMYVFAGMKSAVKSTLPKAVNGIIQDDGIITDEMLASTNLNNKALLLENNINRAKSVGFVFRDPSGSFICRTAFEEFSLSLLAVGEKPPKIYRMKEYGLFDVRDNVPETLSGGEQQRLNCASIMERSVDLIVADFFGSNLDNEFLDDFFNWLSINLAAGVMAIVRMPELERVVRNSKYLVAIDGLYEVVTRERLSLRVSEIRRNETVKERALGELLVECSGLQHKYAKVPLDLSIRQNEIVILAGPNGSGKTTFVRTIAGQTKKSAGNLMVDRTKVAPMISYQFPNAAILSERIRDVLSISRSLHFLGFTYSEWKKRVVEFPASVRKKITLLAAAENSIELVILDEPTAGLGIDGIDYIIRLINEFPDKSFLIISHDKGLFPLGRVVDLEAK